MLPALILIGQNEMFLRSLLIWFSTFSSDTRAKDCTHFFIDPDKWLVKCDFRDQSVLSNLMLNSEKFSTLTRLLKIEIKIFEVGADHV